eukprot:CAMPEP_0172313224 /NCGR_PEP_ID=MMETSP1058-20130122/19725_1 /TAXON_ID=83371 /ORGANISM="Detonula confervacea, Strain CCMP 353" /LENGTH=775 /DNA_ID=CAMNT_0013026841 /DNA_START=248 /DNA_END=2572 /DNA_ORIENTATION=+
MANTACHDALSKCIRLPHASSDGGAILEGSIIEMDTPPFQPGKLLLGEIIEIVIMDAETMTPLAVYNEKTVPPQRNRALSPTSHSISREELLQKQREQQQLHYQQSQALLQQHQEETQQLDALQREGRIPIESKTQLSAEMEHTHQRELLELQENHQREQSEMLDLIFESASVASKGTGVKSDGGKQNMKDESQPTQEAGTAKNATHLWNRAAVATVAAGAMNQSHIVSDEEVQTSHSTNDAPASENKAAGRWNRAAVATVAAGTMNQSSAQTTTEGTATPLTNNSSTKKHPEEQKKELTKLRREEVQSVMRDQTLGKAEKQKRLAEIKAKYAALASSQAAPQVGEPSSSNNSNENKSISRWNSAAVSAAAVNTMSHQSPKDEQAQTQQQSPSNNGNQSRRPNRWKTAGASALSANTFTTSFRKMKLNQGAVTPMSEFIQKLKANDPSTTTIMLDGRKGVSEADWTDLFDSLEDNTHLTDLSVSNCGLDDSTAVSLVLALVENESLTSLNLSYNRELSNSTGKSFLKVLKQSNAVLKQVNIEGTNISSKISGKIQSLLDLRDDTKKLEKLQASRQMKIKALLAFSASDEVSPSSARLSQRLLEIDQEGNDKDTSKSVTSKSIKSGSTSASSGERSKKSKNTRGKKKKRSPTGESEGALARSTSSSSRHSHGSGGRRSSSSSTHSRDRHTSIASSGASSSHWQSAATAAAKKSADARQKMVTLGGDMTQVGKNMVDVRQARKMRGECEHCGQKCYNKTMFKSTPLSVPNKVHEGRC